MARAHSRIESALADLEREGTLSAAQRAAVGERLARALREGRGFDVTAIVASFGALLVAAGLLYLIGYNWEALPKAAKLALVFGIWIALHGAGFALAEKPGTHPRVGRALTLLGVLSFGGAIGLVAQIYHLSAHYPNAILVWWALSVPVVLVTRSRAILVAVMAIGILWVAWCTGVWTEDRPRDDERLWMANFTLVGVAVAAAFQALAALAAGGSQERLEPVLRSPVLVLASAAPFVLAFHEPWNHGRERTPGRDLVPVVVAVVCAAILLGLANWRRGFRAARDGWILIGVALLLGLGVLAAPGAVPILGNVVLFGGALALVALGVRESRPNLATWGMFLFAAGVVARYFEYLWDKLEGAYAFLATGSLFLVAAFLFENRRRALAARTKGASP
ncbi:MAG: DUF2157 domain-containing protein [Planctomycetota bacterium]|nr:DUF2157 domain-containing protein [Planctomycetota bacterium]